MSQAWNKTINFYMKKQGHSPDESRLTVRVRITISFAMTKRKVSSWPAIISLQPYSILCWAFSTEVNTSWCTA